ncbi:MAG: hypothetical protein LBM21_01505, partial [Coriobacteriales bacterium]|nr:hypothetical protein [Coriobacteriales bacterium]
MINVLIDGYAGRMGSTVAHAVNEANDMQVVGGFDPTLDNV